MRNIPYSRQDINEDDINAVVEVLRSNFITQGPAVADFEKSIIDYCKCKYAAAVSNEVAALHLSLLALGVGENDLVWLSTVNFVSSANCALYVGASIDFLDVESKTGNISIDKLKKKLERARAAGALPNVLIVTHLGGDPCDMQELSMLSRKYGFVIVENAIHALGSSYYGNEKVGNCKYSDITVFSFHPVKSISTGEGGMITTNSYTLLKRILLFRSNGVTKNSAEMTIKPEGGWSYEQQLLGYNYRLTDIQCALGVSQMKRLDAFIARRKALAIRYDKLLKGLPLMLPKISSSSSWHLYIVHIGVNKYGVRRKELYEKLKDIGIGVAVHYMPLHLQPFFKKLVPYTSGEFSNSENFYSNALSLPIFPSMSEEEQDYIVDSLKEILLSSSKL